MAGANGYPEKEYYEGRMNGRSVKFNRVWSGHRFTDAECEALCDGKEITVKGCTGRKGPFDCKGVLAEQEYNGHKYMGFKISGFLDKIPASWCGHTFTDDEIIMLESGSALALENLTSKKGNKFSCKVTWGEEDGRMKIIPQFD